MNNVTFIDVRGLEADGSEASDVTLAMTEDEFRAFYDRTARGLMGYLSRVSGSRQLAEDLLQEAYYRLLRAGTSFEDENHRRNYLYRVATNLVMDMRRSSKPVDGGVDVADVADPARTANAEERADVRHALRRLKPRERALLWLAYAEGSSHGEIANVLGLRKASIKVLLFRARRKLAALLHPQVRT